MYPKPCVSTKQGYKLDIWFPTKEKNTTIKADKSNGNNYNNNNLINNEYECTSHNGQCLNLTVIH